MRMNSRLGLGWSRSVLATVASIVALWLTWWWAASQSWLLEAGLQSDVQAATKSLSASETTTLGIISVLFLLSMVSGFVALATLSTDEAFSMTKATLAGSVLLLGTTLVSSALVRVEPSDDQVALAMAHPILVGQTALFYVVLTFGVASFLVFAWKYFRHEPTIDFDDWE